MASKENIMSGDNFGKENQWSPFYEALADKLRALIPEGDDDERYGSDEFRERRRELIAKIQEEIAVIDKRYGVPPLRDELPDGTKHDLADICPFTVMGLFNRGIKDINKKIIAEKLASFLGGVSEEVPNSFDTIPDLHYMTTWFFAYKKNRQDDDIDILWKVFDKAIEYADAEENTKAKEEDFVNAFDEARSVFNVDFVKLSIGLFWIRPMKYVSLDENSRDYIEKELGMPIDKYYDGKRYVRLLKTLEERFKASTDSVSSYPELCVAARDQKNLSRASEIREDSDSYSVDDILKDGCFIDESRLEEMLKQLRADKNMILQGPPGTGKTWLAKRLAYALIGQQDETRMRAVQFHPNLSYEDFIRGWRPIEKGGLKLVDGPLMKMIADTADDDERVMVIEEINRGNPAQIFGEMLTLLEADKRKESEALQLSYYHDDDERVYIPENLYIIGTMNIADRSLALMDFALRRRFAFIDLEPVFNDKWRVWLQNCGLLPEMIDKIAERMTDLNEVISEKLGPQYRIGHSYVTPAKGTRIPDASQWFRRIVEMKIIPLLAVYWPDDSDEVEERKKKLLEGI